MPSVPSTRSIDTLVLPTATRVMLEEIPVTTIAELAALTADDILEVGTRPMLKTISAALAESGLSLRTAGHLAIVLPEPAKTPGTELVEADATLRVERAAHALTLTFLGEPETMASHTTCKKAVAVVSREKPRTLVMRCDFSSPGPTWAEACAQADLSFVEAFVFDTSFQRIVNQASNTLGKLDQSLRACPRVTRFFATGHLEMSSIDHAILTDLYLGGDPLSVGLAKALSSSTFPQLARLVLSVASEYEAANLDAFVDAALGVNAPILGDVHFDVCDEATLVRVLERCLRHESRKRLRHLSFDFTGPVNEDQLAEDLGRFKTTAVGDLEIGLPLDATRSRRFSRKMRAELSCLRDSANWQWAGISSAIYANW